MPEASPAAFFDVDGTLLKSNIVEYLGFFQRHRLPPWAWRRWLLLTLAKAPGYFALDQVSRVAFCRWFYRSYRGLPVDEVTALSQPLFEGVIRPRLRAEALRTVEQHRSHGHTVVLLSGGLDFIVQPLAVHLGAQVVIAAELEERGGRFTGRLATPPLTNDGKAIAIARFTRQWEIDARACFAYGDSISDLPMLEAVGQANAVTPDRRLRTIAARRGWPIHEWNHPQ